MLKRRTGLVNAGRRSAFSAYEPPLPRSYGAGCKMTVEGSGKDINVTAGQWRDSTDTVNLIVPSEFTKQIDATFAEGNDQGGFPDTSLNIAANTWYHYFLIGTGGGKVDAGFDTSVTAANLLTDSQVVDPAFVYFRRIGSIRTDATPDITAFRQRGDKFSWTVPVLDYNPGSDNHTSTPTTITLNHVPLGIETDAICRVIINGVNTSDDPGLLRPTAETSAVPSITAAPGTNLMAVFSNDAMQDELIVEIDTSAQLEYEQRTDTSTNIDIIVTGWFDRRDRDD